jgi:hypothetical protein
MSILQDRAFPISVAGDEVAAALRYGLKGDESAVHS